MCACKLQGLSAQKGDRDPEIHSRRARAPWRKNTAKKAVIRGHSRSESPASTLSLSLFLSPFPARSKLRSRSGLSTTTTVRDEFSLSSVRPTWGKSCAQTRTARAAALVGWPQAGTNFCLASLLSARVFLSFLYLFLPYTSVRMCVCVCDSLTRFLSFSPFFLTNLCIQASVVNSSSARACAYVFITISIPRIRARKIAYADEYTWKILFCSLSLFVDLTRAAAWACNRVPVNVCGCICKCNRVDLNLDVAHERNELTAGKSRLYRDIIFKN